jgi:hypothetical protein
MLMRADPVPRVRPSPGGTDLTSGPTTTPVVSAILMAAQQPSRRSRHSHASREALHPRRSTGHNRSPKKRSVCRTG